VTFAGVGDAVTVEAAERTSLSVTGPFASDVPSEEDNLVLRAAALMGVRAAITLEKNLPVASGIGGGSADAAATLRALAQLANRAMPSVDEVARLGADVPVCLTGGLARMRGVGERVETLAAEPPSIPMVLVNPGVAVSTPEVFAGLARRDWPGMEEPIPDWSGPDFLDWLARQRNDLEAPAIGIAPVIADVLGALRDQPGAALARMSGSGATCFALFPDARDAARAAERIAKAHPKWWSVAAVL
jgi:4-diphosphocytidyl-2-C-methyl-D-erythritol kinase